MKARFLHLLNATSDGNAEHISLSISCQTWLLLFRVFSGTVMSHGPFSTWAILRRCSILERETYSWPVAEVIIYVCPLILLTAISSRRCQCDMVSSKELNTDVAEEPLGSTSRLRLLFCTLLCAYSPLSLASLEPLNFLSWFILHRCFAWTKHFVKVCIFTYMWMLLIGCCTEYEFY